MIQLTKLSNAQILVNSDLIEHVEVTPDTVVTLTNGQKFIVRESVDELLERILAFRREILTGVWSGLSAAGARGAKHGKAEHRHQQEEID